MVREAKTRLARRCVGVEDGGGRLERMLATGATDLPAAKTMAANICTEFFSRACLSPDVIEVEIGQKGHWGTLALQSLLMIVEQ